jgi:hypothetical protein
MRKQADEICLRLRDPSKFIRDWQARTYLHDRGEAADAAAREHEMEHERAIRDHLAAEALWREARKTGRPVHR